MSLASEWLLLVPDKFTFVFTWSTFETQVCYIQSLVESDGKVPHINWNLYIGSPVSVDMALVVVGDVEFGYEVMK